MSNDFNKRFQMLSQRKLVVVAALLTLALTASVLGLSEFDYTLEEVRKRLRQAWLGQGPSTTDVSST